MSTSNKLTLAGLIIAAIGTIGTYLALVTPEFRKCVGLEPGSCLLANFNSSGDNSPPGFMREEILNSSWKEIPGTYTKDKGYKGSAYKGSAYVNANGISRNREFVIFDVLDPEGNYTRTEGDCKGLRWRVIRSGYFESKTQVTFTYRDGDWQDQMNQFQQGILSYVCDVSKK